jgi:hypothetical protein
MITLLTLCLPPQAIVCSPVDALGNPRRIETRELHVLRRGASYGLQFTSMWTEVEKFDAVPSSVRPGTFDTFQVQWHTLAMDSAAFTAGIQAIPVVQPAETCSLPTDGRYVFIWNASTGHLSAQVAHDFQSREVLEQRSLPTADGKVVGQVISKASPKVAQAAPSGGIEFVGSYDPTAPPAKYEAFPSTVAGSLADPGNRGQSFLGALKLVSTGETVDDTPLYHCSFAAWKATALQLNVVVARTADDQFWYIWFEGDPPQPE